MASARRSTTSKPPPACASATCARTPATQLSVLKSKQREAARALKLVPSAASDTWDDIKHTVDSVIVDARATATAAVDRFRTLFGG